MSENENPMRVKLDRTLCDGFGICAKHAPEYFPLDDWGYAVLAGDGNIPAEDRDAVLRALMDCPVHAIMEISERQPQKDRAAPPIDLHEAADPEDTLITDRNEAEWGFTR